MNDDLIADDGLPHEPEFDVDPEDAELQDGSAGPDLADAYAYLPVAVDFDGDEADVRAMQAWVDLSPTGSYDLTTKQAVQQVQRRMKVTGYYEGPVDGRWSVETREAVGRADAVARAGLEWLLNG